MEVVERGAVVETVEEKTGPDFMGVRVLVVDPHAAERTLIALVTEQAGAAVIRVPGIKEAIAASSKATATRSPFDVALLAAKAVSLRKGGHS